MTQPNPARRPRPFRTGSLTTSPGTVRGDGLFDLPLPARHDQPVSIAAAVELQASGRDASQRDAIVAALRTGAKTNAELGAIAPRFSARLCELRKLGYTIRTTAIGGGVFSYRLTEGAQ